MLIGYARVSTDEQNLSLQRRRDRRECYASRLPALGQELAHFGATQRSELVDETDPRVELRIASQPLFQTRHANQD
jgi:DNA invertase Pin-like site-specific DNA recombinase